MEPRPTLSVSRVANLDRRLMFLYARGMTSTQRPHLTLDDIADLLGLSRGRISQLRKEAPDFPQPVRRSLRRAEWAAAEIARWARAAGYTYRDDDAQHRIDQYWTQSPPGAFCLVDAHARHGAAVLVYAEVDTRVAVICAGSRLTPAQVKSAGTKAAADWIITVSSQYTLRSPLVTITSSDESAVGTSSLESVARRLGVMLPHYVGDPSETGVLLSALAETTVELAPRPREFDLYPAYRLYAKTPDADLQAAAAHLIAEVEEVEADNFHVHHLVDHGRRARDVLRIGSTMSAAGMVSPGDVEKGFGAMLASPPVDDDVIRSLRTAVMFGVRVIPGVACIIAHDSVTTADLVATTWEPGGPVSGHAMLLGDTMFGQGTAETLEFYRHPTTGELAVVSGQNVRMTRHLTADRSVEHVVLVEDEGAMYLDDAGVAFAPTSHQGLGYGSGNGYAPMVIARELGVDDGKGDTELTRALEEGAIKLTKALDEGTIALNVPIRVATIRDLLTVDDQ